MVTGQGKAFAAGADIKEGSDLDSRSYYIKVDLCVCSHWLP